MTISKPLEVMSLRLSPEDRSNLERIARERHLTLSEVLREGLHLLAQDAVSTGRRRAHATAART
jgi:hypothetical protein